MKKTFISGFVLKILAILFMSIDHIGLCLRFFDINPQLGGWFQIVGRLALPLFAFLLVEGFIHTKNIKMYFLRLGIVLFLISISQIILQYGLNMIFRAGNIFIDLILGLLILYLINQKGFKKLFVIIPSLYAVLSFIVCILEKANNITINWFPYFIRTQYGIYAILLIVGFYLAFVIAKKQLSKQYNVGFESVNKDPHFRFQMNLISVGVFIAITLLYYLLVYFVPQINYTDPSFNIQTYSLIAVIILIFYNGYRGYNAKWFQYGSYLYYPLHIVIIYGVFYVIFML